MTDKYCRNCPRYRKLETGERLCRMNFKISGDYVWEILFDDVPCSCDYYTEFCIEEFNNDEKGKDFEHPKMYTLEKH